jgi:hypothetical protein
MKLKIPSKTIAPTPKFVCLSTKHGQQTLPTNTQTSVQSGTTRATCAPDGTSGSIISITASKKRAT